MTTPTDLPLDIPIRPRRTCTIGATTRSCRAGPSGERRHAEHRQARPRASGLLPRHRRHAAPRSTTSAPARPPADGSDAARERLGLDRRGQRRASSRHVLAGHDGNGNRTARRPAPEADAGLRLHLQRAEVGHAPVRARLRRGSPPGRRRARRRGRRRPRGPRERGLPRASWTRRHGRAARRRVRRGSVPPPHVPLGRPAPPHPRRRRQPRPVRARTADGRALDGRQLYAWCRTAGFLYEAHLRAELTGRLGVELGAGPQRHRRRRRDPDGA